MAMVRERTADLKADCLNERQARHEQRIARGARSHGEAGGQRRVRGKEKGACLPEDAWAKHTETVPEVCP